jgi:RNA polymerase sigma-70 factor (ECF subfamily)
VTRLTDVADDEARLAGRPPPVEHPKEDRRDLVERARTGDAQAWEALYRGLYPRLRAYLVGRAGSHVADDLASETMTRAVAAMGRYRHESAGFDGWVFGIARRVSADHHRGLHRRPLTAVADDPAPIEEPLDIADDHAELRRAFAQLPADDRELLELRVVAGLSADEVAGVLGKRSGAVRTAQCRALARLRRLLEVEAAR